MQMKNRNGKSDLHFVTFSRNPPPVRTAARFGPDDLGGPHSQCAGVPAGRLE